MTDREMESTGGFAAPASRRTLLLALAGGVVAMGALTIPGAGLSPSRAMRRIAGQVPLLRNYVSLAHADMTEWSELAGSLFRTDSGAELRLAGVEPLPSSGARPAGLRERAFVAVFEVARGVSLPGDLIHRMRRRGGPSFDIYLAAADAAAPRRMHAVFN